MKLAMLTGGSIMSMIGLLTLMPSPLTLAGILLAHCITGILVEWLRLRRPRQGQQCALEVIQAVGRTPASVRVDKDGGLGIRFPPETTTPPKLAPTPDASAAERSGPPGGGTLPML